MTISNVSFRTATIVQPMLDLRARLDELQRQLGTGEKSTTYAGLGVGRAVTVSVSAQLSAISSYQDTMTNVDVRIGVGTTVLARMSAIGREVKAAAKMPAFEPDAGGQTTMQKTSMAHFAELIGLLNAQAGNRYIFAGTSGDQAPVETVENILNGIGTQAGLKQIISERNQADGAAAGGMGRLAVSLPTASSIQVAEDAVSPFGLKLLSLSTTMAGATVTAPAGSPPAEEIDLTAAAPVEGDTATFAFTLPDGTVEEIVLTATAATPPGTGQFTIGASPAATTTNLQTALTAAISTMAETSLSAASAIVAARNFFDIDAANPPQRVAGPPFATATALVNGTTADTVMWYTGEAGSGSARATATARIDEFMSVSYGMRANEQGIRWMLEHVAVAAATTYPVSDPNSADRYRAVNDRLVTALEVPAGVQTVEDIDTELAAAQITMAAVKARQRQAANTLTDTLQNIQGVDNDELGARVLALHTQLQATVQVTSMLYQTSLVNYL
jgi:flagellin-like hook-associated protein FlgL